MLCALYQNLIQTGVFATRTLSAGEAAVLAQLELERPELVPTRHLAALLADSGIGTPVRVFAARLRAKGWLLPTDQRGVWEFAPAALAGPYSSGDPLLPLRSFLANRPDARCGLTFQAAAWAHGLADRVPPRPEVALADTALVRRLLDSLDGSVFVPASPYVQARGAPTLAVESVIVQMCAKPIAVRSWASAVEWLPDLAAEATASSVEKELAGRHRTVAIRAGYLLQALRPDIAAAIADASNPAGRVWFGSRGRQRRHDERWQVADTLLPFDPRALIPAS
ncbi:MAG: type IV toxin-antitoxin system AbiEi family antitoxin [Bifidobacteriaceae bacterium]|jgi:hypothetical protein|nr:type IV toxin-antitoxin system AbiEi family antitoxin [Bifidobacteriaceae bacterium]